jgi:hypothetical protein
MFPTRTSSCCAAVALAIVTPLSTVRAQGVEWQEPTLRVELSAAGSGAFLTDGNGLEVRAGLAPALGLAAAWPAGHWYTVSVFARGSTASVDVSENGSHWSAGHTRELDLGAAIERRLLGDLVAVRLGGGASWLSGPTDVSPFRFLDAGSPHLSGEAGASVRLIRALPVFGVVAAQGVRYGGASVAGPAGGNGTVTRILGGVRYGR